MQTVRKILVVALASAALRAGSATGYCAEAIVLAGQVVARISARGEFGSVRERAADIDKRITEAISVEDVGNPKLWVSPGPGVPSIYIGRTLLMKVYPEDARPYGCKPLDLAKQWADNFRRQFPLAEPCIRMGNAAAASEAARAQARVAASANVKVPPQDWAIVMAIMMHVAQARAMTETEFNQVSDHLVSAIWRDVVRHIEHLATEPDLPTPPHRPGACPDPGGCPGCRAAMAAAVAPGLAGIAESTEPTQAAVRRILSGLRLARILDEDRFRRDRVMMAWTIVKAVRQEFAAATE